MYVEDELRALNEMSGIVYTITNLVSGRVVYVGKTVGTFNKRYGSGKLIGAERVAHSTNNKFLKDMINEYGVENFKVDIVYSISEDESKLPKRKNRKGKIEELLLLKEAQFTYEYKSYWTNGGCNIACQDMFVLVYKNTRAKTKKREILIEWTKYVIMRAMKKHGHINHIYSTLERHMNMWIGLGGKAHDVFSMLLEMNIFLTVTK